VRQRRTGAWEPGIPKAEPYRVRRALSSSDDSLGQVAVVPLPGSLVTMYLLHATIITSLDCKRPESFSPGQGSFPIGRLLVDSTTFMGPL